MRSSAALLLLLQAASAGAWTALVPQPLRAWRHEPASCPSMQHNDHFADNDDGPFDSDPRVDLLEEGTGRKLPCYLAASVEYEGEVFSALYPVDAPVVLATPVVEGQVYSALHPLPEEEESEALLEKCMTACACANIELRDTPVVRTASGPGVDSVEGDVETLPFVEETEDDDDDGSEQAVVLTQVGRALSAAITQPGRCAVPELTYLTTRGVRARAGRARGP